MADRPAGGGSTYNPALEVRVSTLEADVRDIRAAVREMKNDIREERSHLEDEQPSPDAMNVDCAILIERLNQLPTKSYVGWSLTLGLSAIVAALTVLSRLGFLVFGAAG